MNPSTSASPSSSALVYNKADSTNLPKMDYCMILEYMANSDKHNIAEIRGAKTLMSSRDSYLESAVGYVELHRTTNMCKIRAKVTPEHRISQKLYIVTVEINEILNTINSVTCDGCAAAAGGCKHGLVFLFWLNKKSENPSTTSVECYWIKPSLTRCRTEPIAAEDIYESKKTKLLPRDSNVLRKLIEESCKHDTKGSLLHFYTQSQEKSLNLFDMTLAFVQEETDLSFQNYFQKLNAQLNIEKINEIEQKTKKQVDCNLWHSIRQGRLTASKIYEASKCTSSGTLVEQILGGYKVPETKAIKRGKKLESLVIKEAKKVINKEIHKSGFMLINALVGASPDGIGDDFIVEVKCPLFTHTVKNYVENQIIKNKYLAQLQLQMHATHKLKGVFVVADPSFENNKKIELYWVKYDKDFVNSLLEDAMKFWQQFVFGKILASAS